MVGMMMTGLVAYGGIPVGGGPGWHAVAYPVKTKVVRVERDGSSSLELKSLSTGGPSLNLTAGQWYRYHSITTDIWYYPDISTYRYVASRIQVPLNAGESTPIWIDSLEIFLTVRNQNPNLVDTAYIWEDNNGKPGSLIYGIPFRVPTYPTLTGWRLLLHFDDPLPVQSSNFWVGYRSLVVGNDTVFVSSEPCTGCDSTRNRHSANFTNWSPPDGSDWGVAVFARKSHATDEGVWAFVFPNWPFITTQLDGDTLQVVHRNWGGNSLNTMGGALVVSFRGSSDTTTYTLTPGPYPSTAEDTFATSLAPYVGQGYEGVITLTAWSAQPGDQDLTNDTLRFTDYVFPNYTVWAEGFEFSISGWTAYDMDGNGSTWAVYVGSGMHTGYYGVGDTARSGESNVLVGPAWTLGGTPGDASYGNVLTAFVNVPAGASVTLTVQALDGPNPGTSNVLWQNSHALTGLVGKAGWVKVQDTLPAGLNGQTVYPAWRLSTTSTTPSLVLMDNIHGRSAALALEVGEESPPRAGLRIVWEGPRMLRFAGEHPRTLVVLDALGRRVFHRFSPEGMERIHIPLPAGVYTVVVEGSSPRRIRLVLP